jgi:hypothetical protein
MLVATDFEHCNSCVTAPSAVCKRSAMYTHRGVVIATLILPLYCVPYMYVAITVYTPQQPHPAMHELKYLAQPFYCTISSADITAETSTASSSDNGSVQSAVDVHLGTAAGASHFTAKVTLRIANRYQHSADLGAVLAFAWTVKVNGRTTASNDVTALQQQQQQCSSSSDSSSGSCAGVQAVLQFTGAAIDAHAGEECFLHVTARSVTAATTFLYLSLST